MNTNKQIEDGVEKNAWKYICDSCGVEWVKNSAALDSQNSTVKHNPNCESCCPQIDADAMIAARKGGV